MMQTFNPAKLPQLLRLLGGILLLFFIGVAVLGFWAGFQDIQVHLQTLPPYLYGLLIALFFFNALCRGARWPLGAQKLKLSVSLLRISLIYVAGFSMAATPGKVGTAIRLWLLNTKNRVRYRDSAPLLVLDQVTDLIAILGLTAWGVMAGVALFGASTWFNLIILASGLGFGIILLFSGQTLRWFIKSLYRLCGRRKRRFFASVIALFRRLHCLFKPSFLLLTIVLATAGWLAEIYGLYAVVNALGYDISLPTAAAIFGVTLLVSIFSLLPGGIGIAEAGMAGLLVVVGVPLSAAVVATVLVRFFTLWLGVLLGLSVLPFALRLTKK